MMLENLKNRVQSVRALLARARYFNRHKAGGVLENDSIYQGPADEFNKLQFGGECLRELLCDMSERFENVLDIGSGSGAHAEIFRSHGKEVLEVDLGMSCYHELRRNNDSVVRGDYMELDLDRQFDLVWACHVLEHQKNVNSFLTKISHDLREGGILAITVPPLKHEIVGGHLSVWNAGLLLYNLVIARFNCREPKILQYGYNISVIITKETIELPELSFDKGDIDACLKFFPEGLAEPFDGDIRELNWKSKYFQK